MEIHSFVCIHRSSTTIHPNEILLISLLNLPLLLFSAPAHITMSSPADSVSRFHLPVSATGIDLIDTCQLPSDSLYPPGHLVTTASFTEADYRSRLSSRLGAPPRTHNRSYLDVALKKYPELLRSWTSTVAIDPPGGATSLGGIPPSGAVASQAGATRMAGSPTDTASIATSQSGVTHGGATPTREDIPKEGALASQVGATRSTTRSSTRSGPATSQSGVTHGGATPTREGIPKDDAVASQVSATRSADSPTATASIATFQGGVTHGGATPTREGILQSGAVASQVGTTF
jgi:hypothetical protein